MNLSNLVWRLDMTAQLNLPTGGARHSADIPAFAGATRTAHEEDRREDGANRQVFIFYFSPFQRCSA
jgi:hypothetical protein